jgi:hypothetical protein
MLCSIKTKYFVQIFLQIGFRLYLLFNASPQPLPQEGGAYLIECLFLTPLLPWEKRMGDEV